MLRNSLCKKDISFKLGNQGRVEGHPTGGAEEVYVELVMRAVDPGWTGRNFF